MQPLIFGHSFAGLVAMILLPGLMFYFLNKKKTNERRNAADADPGASGAMTTLTKSESGGSSSSPTETTNGVSIGNNYEVFLSFRGSDTRYSFTDHLYKGLCDAGIHTFRDNEELRQGEEIGPDLLAAIKNSQILIPILSVNYGESKWCLEELVQIMECKKNNTGQIVLPVFYKVAPADVRYQKGRFGEAFNKRERREHARRSDSTMLEKWKKALGEVGDLKGREANGSEAELVKSIVQQVLRELKKKFELVIPEILVGIDHHVEKVMEFVDNNSRATLFVGIHGMGGIGKTTLAKTIFNKLFNQFEHRSFIADVRESCKGKGIHYLQNQLILDILNQKDQVYNNDEGTRFISSKLKDKKVLILLDDVSDDDQLKALAGNHNWFSLGSMIIITTRNKSILNNARVEYQYKHEEMDPENSLILFCRHAFRRDSPPGEFENLTHDIVSTTGGLPLSLTVLGSFLCGKETMVWKCTIEKLRKFPNEEVQKKLRISYEVLTHEQKQIFLDIACFFIGFDKRIPSYMWNACDYFPEDGIEVLKFLSLIKVGDDNELIMHDQLRDLGREIVREENKKDPGERSRLWDSEALKMLKGNEETRKVEAIRLGKYSSSGARETANQDGNVFDQKKRKKDGTVFTGKQFKKLRNLRFLDASGAHFSGDFKNSFRKLKWLQWQHCPLTFEASNFCTEELAVLNLAKSEISDKWQGWSFIKKAKELKFLDLTDCDSLKKTPFLSAFKKLEVLIVRDCANIEQIDSSIGKMKSLVHLDLSGCGWLKGLPVEVGKLEALKVICLHYTGIRQLPDSIGDLQNLEALNIGETEIEELPNDIGRLRKLQELEAWNCLQLRRMPESIRNLSSLQHLDLDNCVELQSLPVLPSSLKSLIVTCGSRRLPALSNQTHLECSGEPPSIPSEESLNTPSELEILKISDCLLLEILDVSQFNHMRKLSVKSNDNIHEIRGLDKLNYLERLDISGCDSIEMLKLPKSQRLKRLTVEFCGNLVEIQDLVALEVIHISNCRSIERLALANCEGLEILVIDSCASIEMLELPKSQRLKRLTVGVCSNLVIRGPVALEEINIYGCLSIERLDLTNCEGLKILHALCDNLGEIQGLNGKMALEEICISGCRSIEKLDLTKSVSLKVLHVKDCDNLVEIQGLNRKTALEEIHISGCHSIEKLDLTKSEGLKKLRVVSCENLSEIQGLHKLEYLKLLDMSRCRSFGRLPDLCCSVTLDTLAINYGDNLHNIQSLGRFPSCKSLWIEDYKSLAKLLNLSNFCNLETLVLSRFHELREISGLEKSTSLKNMSILGCSSIEILPDLSSCTNLVNLVVQDCRKLRELRGLEKLEQLMKLDISGCKSLKTIPELSRATIYHNYESGKWKSDDAMTVLSNSEGLSCTIS